MSDDDRFRAAKHDAGQVFAGLRTEAARVG
jgi:hypothetical protein